MYKSLNTVLAKTVLQFNFVEQVDLSTQALSVVMESPSVGSAPLHQQQSSLFVYLTRTGESESNASSRVLGVLSPVQGLLSVDVVPDTKERLLLCSYDPSVIGEGQFTEKLNALDSFEAFVSTSLKDNFSGTLISVEGMTCNSCVKLIESTIAVQEGIAEIKVSLLNSEAFVVYNPDITNASDISTAIYDMGFDTKLIVDTASASTSTSVPARISVTSPEVSVKTIIHVEGMVCNSCVQNIENNVGELNGVHEVKVSLSEKTATVSFDPSLTSSQQLAEAIEELGFEANNETAPGNDAISSSKSQVGKKRIDCIGINGMTCHSCVNLIEATVGELSGVMSMQVSLACKEGTVEYNDGLVTREQIRDTINEMGFIVTYVTGKYSPY